MPVNTEYQTDDHDVQFPQKYETATNNGTHCLIRIGRFAIQSNCIVRFQKRYSEAHW